MILIDKESIYELFMQTKQEVGDNLSVCVLKLITEVVTLPKLVANSLVKVEI